MDFSQIMKKMEEMQSQFLEAQNKQKDQEFIGIALGGKVTITMVYVSLGNYKVKRVHIDKSLLIDDEVDILEDLLMAAFNDAMKKIGESSESLFSGLMPPGLKLPF